MVRTPCAAPRAQCAAAYGTIDEAVGKQRQTPSLALFSMHPCQRIDSLAVQACPAHAKLSASSLARIVTNNNLLSPYQLLSSAIFVANGFEACWAHRRSIALSDG